MNPTLCRVAVYPGPGFPRPATNRIDFSSTVARSKIQKLVVSEAKRTSKIEARLLLLLLFLWTFFLCSRSRGCSFALFLLFGDNFRPGSSFGFSHGRFFFDYRRDYGERSQIGLHLGSHAGRQLNIAHVNGISNVQLRDVHCDAVWQIAGETFDCQRAQALLKQSAESFDAHGGARWFERNFGLNHLVHRDSVKIHVANLPTDRRVLHLLYERGAS